MQLDIKNLKEAIKNRLPQPVDIKKHYAITIPLYYNENEDRWELIYEVRSRHLSHQPLEISFPGGRVEVGETYEQAAIRETMEELLIGEENIELLGESDYLVTTGTLTIKCFAIQIKNIKFEDIKPSSDEVDHLFTVPLDFFIENEPIKSVLTMSVDSDDKFPYDLIPNGRKYNFAKGKNIVLFYKYNKYIIWGFTAKMTNSFIGILRELGIIERKGE